MSDETRVPKADALDGYAIKPHDVGDTAPPAFRFDNADGYVNEITGIGDWNRDKTFGGLSGGPNFLVRFLAGAEVENRWRGSDLGGRIVETIPDEMTREGWELKIQPDENGGDEDKTDAAPTLATSPEINKAGPLPDDTDDGPAIVEAIDNQTRELGMLSVMREALCYERAYGGAGIFIGVDEKGPSGKPFRLDGLIDPITKASLDGQILPPDHEQNLTAPLDENKINRITHLTALSGGWDGELIAWRYYADPRHAKYGEPEIYMLRNLGVPIAAPPAPGERMPPQQIPADPGSPFGPLIFFVHESRLLIFPGTAVSRRARVQMRGWGDSKFVRVNKVLSDYDQTWGAIAILMQEWSQGVLQMEGFAQLLASQNPKDQGKVAQRAMLLQLTQSIARTRIIDSKETYKREISPLTGIADVLGEFSLRLAAAADMPLSLLMGQVQGGLGDAASGDIRFFYDRIRAWQRERMMPQVHRILRLLFLSKSSPTRGKEPKRWSVEPNPLYQLTEKEQAELRKLQMETDTGYIGATVLTPQEVTASRFAGSKWTSETTIDLEGRAELAKMYGEEQNSVKAPVVNSGAPTDKPAPGTPSPQAASEPVGAPAPSVATEEKLGPEPEKE